MGKGRPKQELFLRNGVYYARFSATERYSTDTGDIVEAARRLEAMRYHRCAYKYIQSKPKSKGIAKTPFRMLLKGAHERGIKPVEPVEPVTSIDIAALLDKELSLKEAANLPSATYEYWRGRYEQMKRFLAFHPYDLSTFDLNAALKYVDYRIGHIEGADDKKHKVGFNNRPCSISTIKKEIGLFKKLWAQWRDDGLEIDKNPWSRVPTPKPKKATAMPPEPYTLEEAGKIIAAIENPIVQALIKFQLLIGSRPGSETLELTAEMIEAGKIWSFKKRRMDDYDYTDKAKAFFKEHLDGKLNGITSGYVVKCFKKACKKAKVRVGKPYDFRKVYATESLVDFDMEIVRKAMRHNDARTTEKFYAKVRNAATRKARLSIQDKIFDSL